MTVTENNVVKYFWIPNPFSTDHRLYEERWILRIWPVIFRTNVWAASIAECKSKGLFANNRGGWCSTRCAWTGLMTEDIGRGTLYDNKTFEVFQDQEPFPDTFGYSAPTGVISSFGLKTVSSRFSRKWWLPNYLMQKVTVSNIWVSESITSPGCTLWNM